jgi:hypothetical protein
VGANKGTCGPLSVAAFKSLKLMLGRHSFVVLLHTFDTIRDNAIFVGRKGPHNLVCTPRGPAEFGRSVRDNISCFELRHDE